MHEELSFLSTPSPIGRIGIWASQKGVTHLEIGVSARKDLQADQKSFLLVSQAAQELSEYFAGNRTKFKVPVDLTGTEFQRNVWREISQIAFGKTRTYSDIAQAISNPKASRAVGAAVGANPVPIILGCHRVMGSSGALTGYSGGKGLVTKKQLLKLEGISFK